MDQIIGAIIFIIIIIAQIVKSIREVAPPKQLPAGREKNNELLGVTRPKPTKQPQRHPKPNKQRLTSQPPLPDKRSVFSESKVDSARQKALVKQLAPQGEGERFGADPGTLETGRILAPTIDPTVKPELESITGIYEQGVMFADSSVPAFTLNIADCLAKPEGIIQAVILAEVLNRPAWQETPRQQI